MRNIVGAAVVLASVGMFWTAASADPVVVSNSYLQAVDSNGSPLNSAANGGYVGSLTRVVIEGVVLNNPEDMLGQDYNCPVYMGGQWQVYVQGEGDDHAGTALWMGQKYNNITGGPSYTESEWLAEMLRVNNPLDASGNAHVLRAGDRIRVEGYTMNNAGKTNVNERHDVDESMDFTITWLGSPGLPTPELITLDKVKDDLDNWKFDSTSATGAEYYQARLVRLNDVSFTSGGASGWGQYGTLTVTDGTGRTMPIQLGVSDDFLQSLALESTFDVIGIFDQEDKNGADGYKAGYRMWVLGYDGGATTLGQPVPEPTTLLVLGLGGVGLAAVRRRRATRKDN